MNFGYGGPFRSGYPDRTDHEEGDTSSSDDHRTVTDKNYEKAELWLAIVGGIACALMILIGCNFVGFLYLWGGL